MKYVTAPEKQVIQIVNLYDMPMKDPEGGPALKKYEEWLLDRTADPVFLSHGGVKEGAAALDLLVLARRQIREAADGVAVHGFDDEVAARLRQSILKPTGGLLGPQALEHNWADWVEVWKSEPKAERPAVLVAAAE
ncbi:MAG TPA: hypothetical protein VJN18_32755 [Polyangiaceae bacterium]|nr:hypothetical protein [Polyangiaceae bacterium]